MPTVITFELLNQYFKRGKKNAAYSPSENNDEKSIIDIYNELRIHSNGEYPKALIDKQRPSEPEHVKQYRKEIFEAITKETVSRVITCLSKIRRSADWSVKFDPKKVSAKIIDGEKPEDYFEKHFPSYDSLTYWMFSVCLKNYLIDANGICAVLPIDFNPLVNEYIKPFPYIFNSDQVLEYQENDYCIIKSKDKSTYLTDDGKTMVHNGDIFWVINYEKIIKYVQINSKGDLKAIIDYTHMLGYMPVFKLGGLYLRSIDATLIYESRIQSIVPRLNKASREDNDLDVSVVRHLFPEKWEFVSMECPKCNGVGKINSGKTTTRCKTCNGTGHTVSSPFQSHLIKPASIDQQQVPTPPAGYIEKDVEIIKVQDERIEKHIYKALATINMEFLSKTPNSESGIAKEVDKDELNNFVHSIAEDLVRIMDRIFMIGYDFRYKVIVPNAEDRKAMLPAVNVPEKYDMLSVNYLIDEYQKAKTAKMNPVIISKMEEEIATKRFNTDPNMKDELLTILKLDPFAGMTSDEKMSYIQNGFITKEDAVISANIVSFVRQARLIDKNFYALDLATQQLKMVELATVKINSIDAAAKLKIKMLQPANDPNNGN